MVPRAAALGGDPRGGAPWWGPGATPLAFFPSPDCPVADALGAERRKSERGLMAAPADNADQCNARSGRDQDDVQGQLEKPLQKVIDAEPCQPVRRWTAQGVPQD